MKQHFLYIGTAAVFAFLILVMPVFAQTSDESQLPSQESSVEKREIEAKKCVEIGILDEEPPVGIVGKSYGFNIPFWIAKPEEGEKLCEPYVIGEAIGNAAKFQLSEGETAGLPPGLEILPSEGQIVGIPTSPGKYVFGVAFSDANKPIPQVVYKRYSITIVEAPPQGESFLDRIINKIKDVIKKIVKPSKEISKKEEEKKPEQEEKKLAKTAEEKPVAECKPLRFTVDDTLRTGVFYEEYRDKITAEGGPGLKLQYFTKLGGGLPKGIKIPKPGKELVIEGIPKEFGDFVFSVSATDNCSDKIIVQDFKFKVIPRNLCADFFIETEGQKQAEVIELPPAFEGRRYLIRLIIRPDIAAVINSKIKLARPISWSISEGALPPGFDLSVTSKDGDVALIHSTPIYVPEGSAGEYKFTVSAFDSCPFGKGNKSAEQKYILRVLPKPEGSITKIKVPVVKFETEVKEIEKAVPVVKEEVIKKEKEEIRVKECPPETCPEEISSCGISAGPLADNISEATLNSFNAFSAGLGTSPALNSLSETHGNFAITDAQGGFSLAYQCTGDARGPAKKKDERGCEIYVGGLKLARVEGTGIVNFPDSGYLFGAQQNSIDFTIKDSEGDLCLGNFAQARVDLNPDYKRHLIKKEQEMPQVVVETPVVGKPEEVAAPVQVKQPFVSTEPLELSAGLSFYEYNPSDPLDLSRPLGTSISQRDLKRGRAVLVMEVRVVKGVLRPSDVLGVRWEVAPSIWTISGSGFLGRQEQKIGGAMCSSIPESEYRRLSSWGNIALFDSPLPNGEWRQVLPSRWHMLAERNPISVKEPIPAGGVVAIAMPIQLNGDVVGATQNYIELKDRITKFQDVNLPRTTKPSACFNAIQIDADTGKDELIKPGYHATIDSF